eukprot:803229_1
MVTTRQSNILENSPADATATSSMKQNVCPENPFGPLNISPPEEGRVRVPQAKSRWPNRFGDCLPPEHVLIRMADESQIPLREVEICGHVTTGGYGDVWRGTLHTREIILKVPKNNEQEMIDVFDHEIEVVRALANSPGVVPLVGTCSEDGFKAIITVRCF